MATAFNLVDYRTVEPVRRARLKLVEPVRAPVTAPVPAEPVAAVAPAPATTQKLLPPAWMVAPEFRIAPAISVHEQQAAYRPAPLPTAGAPYQTVREVPRAAW